MKRRRPLLLALTLLALTLPGLPPSNAFAATGDVWFESSTPGTHTTTTNLNFSSSTLKLLGGRSLQVTGDASVTGDLTAGTAFVSGIAIVGGDAAVTGDLTSGASFVSQTTARTRANFESNTTVSGSRDSAHNVGTYAYGYVSDLYINTTDTTTSTLGTANYSITAQINKISPDGGTGYGGALAAILVMNRSTASSDYTEHAALEGWAIQNSTAAAKAFVWGGGFGVNKTNSGAAMGAIIEVQNTYANDDTLIGLLIQSCCNASTMYSVGPAISISRSTSGNGWSRLIEAKDQGSADIFVIGSSGEIYSPATYGGSGNRPACIDSTGLFYRGTTVSVRDAAGTGTTTVPQC